MKEIFIIRHGQTDYNLKRIVQGRGVDASLNATGREQAGDFYRRYRKEGFEHIFVSSMRRTHESVEGFIADGIPYSAHSDLDEIDWGIHEGKESSPERKEEYRNIVNTWKSGGIDTAVPGGESPRDVIFRLQSFLQLLERRPEKKILIAMHGRSLRIILCAMLDVPLYDMDRFGHSNLCLYKLVYNAGNGKQNSYKLVLKDERAHLTSDQ